VKNLKCRLQISGKEMRLSHLSLKILKGLAGVEGFEPPTRGFGDLASSLPAVERGCTGSYIKEKCLPDRLPPRESARLTCAFPAAASAYGWRSSPLPSRALSRFANPPILPSRS
jgi:hypothetical protein